MTWRKRKIRNTLSDFERDWFKIDIEHALSYLSEEDEKKMRFSKEFVSEYVPFLISNKKKIVLGPMDIEIFELFIFSLLVDYENQKSIPKLHD